MHIVFDTGAFLAGLQLSLNRVYTTQEVIEEVKDKVSRFNLEISISSGKVIVMKPSITSRKKLDKILLKDLNERKLSQTDRSVIALAMDLYPAMVFTDDLSVQNVLKYLGIKYSSIRVNNTATSVYKFKYICKNCKREFNVLHSECPICGGEIIKVVNNT